MKSFIVCVFLLTLVGSGLCARLRREEPAAAEAAAPPAADDSSVSSDSSADDSAGDVPAVPAVTEVDGLGIAIASLEAKPEPDMKKIEILKAIKNFLDMQKAAQTPPPGINIPA